MTVTLEQNGVPYYTVNSQVDVTAAGTGSHVNVERLPGSRVLRVYGSMAVDAQPDVEHVSIDDPALYAAMALRQMLIERGIVVEGEATVEHRPVQDGRGFLSAVDAPLTHVRGRRRLPERPHVRSSCPVRPAAGSSAGVAYVGAAGGGCHADAEGVAEPACGDAAAQAGDAGCACAAVDRLP